MEGTKPPEGVAALMALHALLANGRGISPLRSDEAHLRKSVTALESSLGLSLLRIESEGVTLTAAAEDLLELAHRHSTAPGHASVTGGGVAVAHQRRFVTPRGDVQFTSKLDSVMSFAESLTHATSSVFFWLNDRQEIIEYHARNQTIDLDRYYRRCEIDPMHFEKSALSGRRIAALSSLKERDNSELWAAYYGEIGVGDAIDLLFWHDDYLFGCLSLLRAVDDRPFDVGLIDWEQLRRHLQASLRLHWRVRSSLIEQQLSGTFGLHPRELDVIELVMLAKSNSEIAGILGIGIATVKSHMTHVMDKLGVESRMSLVNMVANLQPA